jgi:hypothetical protein
MSSMRVGPLARVDERWLLDSPFALRTNKSFERMPIRSDRNLR